MRSRQDEDPSVVKPMPEFDPDSLIGRTFLLPPEENGERLRAKVAKKVVEERVKMVIEFQILTSY